MFASLMSGHRPPTGLLAGRGFGAKLRFVLFFNLLLLVQTGAALGAQEVIRNVAKTRFQTAGGAGSALSNAVETILAKPELVVEKTVEGPNPARIGDELHYTIRISNETGNGPARGVVVADTFPVGLELVSAAPYPDAPAPNLAWNLGDIPPGGAVEIRLTARVTPALARDTVFVNVAFAEEMHSRSSAVSGPVQLIGPDRRALSLEHQADLLQAALGETVPFTVMLGNAGDAALQDLQVDLSLPGGLVLVDGSVVGGEVVDRRGPVVIVGVPGVLEPGEDRTVHYSAALVSAETDVLEVMAAGSAEGGMYRSSEVPVWVRVRSQPMEVRTVLGTVWADLNGNGVQDGGEPRLEGVDIWTEDGRIATSDPEGRFSFRNVRPGRHAFRVDPETVPFDYTLDKGTGDAMAMVQADGWTSRTVRFRVLPRGGRIKSLWVIAPSTGARTELAKAGVPLPAVSMPPEVSGSGPFVSDESHAPRALPSTELPDPASLPAGSRLEVVLEPEAAGWPEVVLRLEDGWVPVPSSALLADTPAPDPEVRLDRNRRPWLYWRLDGRGDPRSISVRLQPEGAESAPETIRIDPLRSAQERAADAKAAFLFGPGVEFFAPEDGTVFPTNRVFVGARGEPGNAVALYDGDSLLAEGNLRLDGVHDFIGVDLPPGPHHLQVSVRNSWNQLRWDSLAVHVSGPPARFVAPEKPLRLVADGHATGRVRVRVLDAWGVPVVRPSLVTVSGRGVEGVNPDADPSSLGRQVRTDPGGWLTLELRAGRTVGDGDIRLKASQAAGVVKVQLLPSIRPLVVTGVGQVGLLGRAGAFGAVTARGRLGESTSLTLSFDSRHLDDGQDSHGRSYDPLEESRYPVLGDSGEERVVGASTGTFFAKIARGYDWIVAGDITTDDFAEGLSLSTYRRALPGLAARVSTGPVSWRGFASQTDQALRQLQLRGEGSSGPYELEGGIRPGTERISLETRYKENPQRVLAQEALTRFVDYQIDYERGTLLFKRPVPAADLQQNPVFIVVTFEANGGGKPGKVVGLRSSVDVRNVLRLDRLDSLDVGLTFVRQDQEETRFQVTGADFKVSQGPALQLRGEVAYAQSSDSSGLATNLEGSVRLLRGAVGLSGKWMRIGDRFANPSNLSLRGGTEEFQLATSTKFRGTELRVEYDRLSVKAEDVKRERTAAVVRQRLGYKVEIEARATGDRISTGRGSGQAPAGELKVGWTPNSRLRLWSELRRTIAAGDSAHALPNHYGGGAEVKLFEDLSLEARHLRVAVPGSSDTYSVTSVGLRSAVAKQTEAWGSYQIVAGGDHLARASVLGLNNRWRLNEAWSLNTLVERRVGLDAAPISDVMRALPFVRPEEDYWSAALGAEFTPPNAGHRMTARGELRNGELRSTRLFSMAGELSLDRSLAILMRQEYLQVSEHAGSNPQKSRRRSSLWGLAFRPADNDRLNLLAKFQWLDEMNPLRGGILGRNGKEERLILAVEAIWAPNRRIELGGRYAARTTRTPLLREGGDPLNLRSQASFVGGRLEVELGRWLAFRTNGRMLLEGNTGTARWDVSPELVLLPLNALEVTVGRRLGDLRDPDFAALGGDGWFLNLGIRLTEDAFRSPADFWRPRFGR